MFIYIALYGIISTLLIINGLKIYNKYKRNGSGKFFLLSSIIFSIWLFLFLFAYSSTTNKDILLYISRILFSISIPAYYSLIIFFNKIDNKYNKYKSKINKNEIIIFLVFLIFILFSISTPFVIKDMIQVKNTGYYYEDFGIFYPLYFLIYISSIPALIVTMFTKIKKLTPINKIRFKIIMIGLLLQMILLVIFLAILPILGIYLLQMEIYSFFIPFIVATQYSIYRYYNISLKLSKNIIIIFMISLLLSVIITYGIYEIYYHYISKLDHIILDFWSQKQYVSEKDLIIYLIINILIFKFIYFFLISKITGNNGDKKFSQEILKIREEVPYITNISDLNEFLLKKFSKIFKIKYTKILLINSKKQYPQLSLFFKKTINNNVFINDIIFIEENKNKFKYKKLKKEINDDIYLIFPIYNYKSELIGFFNLGNKHFKELYNYEEIKIIKSFVNFISGHLKYLRIYQRINDLNINLDKKIDEKTMQYNSLVNKQKDFISLISHEIKGPICSAIFQIDCLIDDVNGGNINNKQTKKELNLLNGQLIKIGELTNKLFSIEKYDIGKMFILKEKISINSIIYDELHILQKKYQNITFESNIDNNIGFLDIDKVQMTQVINNLLNNAIKFSTKNNNYPKIYISTYKKSKNVYIEIEDNGKEFMFTKMSNLFEKYSTGKGSSIGLGMGLYLCKKIVELHNGEINASNSEKLGGAKFTIIL